MNTSENHSTGSNTGNYTVLIVDDNTTNLGVLSDYLTDYDFTTLVATDGELALQRAEYAQPHIILLDILMPGMDGFEICRRLKANETTRNIPVIFTTALTETEDKIKGFQAGAVDYITKPFHREEVLARINTHVRLRELSERLEHKVQERSSELVAAITEAKQLNQQLEEEIAERVQAENTIRESEERYRKLVGLSFDGVVIHSQGYIDFVNVTGTKILGRTDPAQLVGKPVIDFVHPDYQAIVGERMQEIQEKGTSAAPIEEKFIRLDGTIVDVETMGIPITYQGRSAVQVVFRDITRRKQAEGEREQLLTRIQEQIQQVQQIMDTVPEGVLLLDVEGQILLANPMAEKNLTVLANASVGDTLTHLSDRPLEELLTSPPQGLWHDVTAQEQHFQIIARPMEVGPAPGGWVMVIRDVTQQREFERRIQQQERLASVGQLAAGIAHDFNNIMATIVLYAQMTARAKELPKRVRDRMVTINQQANHATNLIRQILDFSRRSVLERHPFDLLPFLKEQVQLLERTLPENIVIKLNYGPDEYTVNADPTRMQQMVTNLAVNARDAMPEGGEFHIGLERIEIKSRRRAPLPEMQAGEWVQMTVSDTGTGIPPDALPHIFDPFFTTKAPGKGSGLGLAQVHGIVGQHEGHITVDTHLGKGPNRSGSGTTFTIYLPTLPAHPLEPSALEVESLVQGQGETILLIEDNVTAREAMVESLTLLNYRVVEATNGHRALEILEKHGDEIALVISDVVMPQMGGIALFHALRERGLQIPMLMLTGHPMERELENLRKRGLSGWLLKPPNLEELASAVSQALKKTSSQ